MGHFKYYLIFITLALSACAAPLQKDEDKRPNILLIVADDLGYADLGCFGGDIETPNIDGLAKEGVLFTNFHTSPYCAPTRAMLLSGNDNHIAGMGRQEMISDRFGYEGKLTDRIATLPEVLREAGYHTYIAGKWHLGMSKDADPVNKGFEKTFVNLGSSGNHYNSRGLFEDVPESRYTRNGKPEKWPEGRYSTNLYTDFLIRFIDEDREDGSPFFAMATYTSPHWPLQVDKAFRNKYRDRYNEGYDSLRQRRMESLKKAGIIPGSSQLPPLFPGVTPWDSLTPEEQRKEARKMEIYAGMVDNLDYNIGQLIKYLRRSGKFENTLIIFMSDNGAAAEDFYYSDEYGPFLRKNFSDDYDSMGTPGSFIAYGPQWAEAGSAPFRYFKGYASEGGIVAPLIVSGPGVRSQWGKWNGLATVMDIAPTCFEIAGATYPVTKNGKQLYAPRGESMWGFLNGKEAGIHRDDYIFAFEHGGHTMLRQNGWKLESENWRDDSAGFSLYNLADDNREIVDLRETEPVIFNRMKKEWEQFAEEIRLKGDKK